ncbi:TetR/AcrR family transcriptional regulator [Actinocorallia herbida]|uniref:TetR/AcrR family transcriptional regulator n=1 Tax=Actinocorallia herbida TaxID=58109 RepID=UPI00248225BD|nr:TetR/AcrR family transcriptional regulator [Actinocorallia herbida]
MDAAVAAIGESGTSGWSMRELARRAGVSHAAPAHHFGDKRGLLTALAAEGFTLFAETLTAAGEDLVDLGVAYVRFAVAHRAHFEVMFRPDLYDPADPEVLAPATAARAILDEAAARALGTPDTAAASASAWSIVHGFTELWLRGALPAALGPDPEQAARRTLTLLTRP